MTKFAAVLVALVLLLGCAGTPTKEELASANYGPFPANYQSIVREHMSRILKDPDSARYEFLNPPKEYIHRGIAGYIACVNVNAKNSYGGYVGNRMGYFIIRDSAVAFDWHDTAGLGVLGEVWSLCKKFV